MIYNTYSIKSTFMGKFSFDSDLLEELNKFCNTNNIRSGQISIIGAIKSLCVGYYIQDEKKYIKLDSNTKFAGKPLEIVSCTGNVSIKDSKPFVHAHIVASDSEGNVFGGHLMPGTIIFAGEFIIHSFEGNDFVREIDEQTKLPLWK